MTLPALVVKLDDGTGTFPFDISSKVMGVDGYDVSRGRDDWQGAVTAGELGLTLNNSDGRFTPGSTILASPSPVTVDQRIRVIEYVGGGFGVDGFGTGPFGGYVIRFTGYVKSWPVSWPATVATFSTVSLTATDAQARSERRTLRSMLEEEILLRSPSAYYTLAEAEGSTSAGDTSGNQGGVLGPAGTGAKVAFGVETGLPDGQTGVQFFGGQHLASSSTLPTAVLSSATTALGVVFSTSAAPAAEAVIAHVNGWALVVTTTGRLRATLGGGALATSSAVVTDGVLHVGIVTSDGVTVTVYLDGLPVASTPYPGSTLGFPYVTVGGGVTIFLGSDQRFTGIVSHVATWPTLSAAGAQVVSVAALTSFNGESGTARLTRLAAYAGLALGTLDASLTNVPAQAIAGRSAQDAIQEVVDAEMGLVFIDGSGNLTFHNRNRVRSKTVPDLILDSQYVTPDVQPVTDDQQIVNYFEATAAGTGAASVVRSAASETTHGRYPVSQTYLVQTDAEALDRASWIVTKQAEPTARFGTLSINLYKMTAAMAANVVAALDLNCWLRVTSMATQTPGGTVVDVVIQGWQVAATGESWAITCNVVSRALYTAFVLDSTLLDSTTPLAV